MATGGLFICQMWAIGNALKTLSQLFTAPAQTHLGPAHHLEPLKDDNSHVDSKYNNENHDGKSICRKADKVKICYLIFMSLTTYCLRSFDFENLYSNLAHSHNVAILITEC